MNFFKNLFCTRSSTQTEPLQLGPKGWHISQTDVDNIQSLLPAGTSLEVSKDEMDDDDLLVLSIEASEYKCRDIETAPELIFWARRKGCAVRIDGYVSFTEKFFWGRGKEPTIRLRFDDAPPQTLSEEDFAYGRDKSSLHFQKCDVLQRLIGSKRLLFQILPNRRNDLLAKFDLLSSKAAIEGFASGIFGDEFLSISTINFHVMKRILACGHDEMLLWKKALSSLGFDPGPLDYSKGYRFFRAAEGFAKSRWAYDSEDKVYLDGKWVPWHTALCQQAPYKIRRQLKQLNPIG